MYVFINTLFYNILNSNVDIYYADYDNITRKQMLEYYKKLFKSVGLVDKSNSSLQYISEQISFDRISLLQFKMMHDEYIIAQRLSNVNFFNPICLRTYYKNESQNINKIINFIRFNLVSIIFTLVYTFVNISIFYSTFEKFHVEMKMMNSIIIYKSIAKASASIILLNSMISLLPLLTYRIRLITYISPKYFPHYLGIVLHYLCFTMIVIFSILHISCHFAILNIIYNLSNSCVYDALELDRLGISVNFGSYLKLLPVWTGLLLLFSLICFILIWILLKYKKVRSSIFYNYHIGLALFYFILLLVHGSLNWLRSRQAYYWITIPILIYFVDKYKKIFHTCKLISCYAKVEQDRFIKLTIVKTANIVKYLVDPSMSLDIKIPVISKFEWHKFTITSAPDDDYIILYMQIVGKWTNLLQKYILEYELTDPNKKSIMLYADKPTNNVIKYTTLYNKIILICTGYGITPYISLIRDIIYNIEMCTDKYANVTQVSIVWIINNDADCEIFAKTLSQLYLHSIFDLQIYFTKNIKSELKEEIIFFQDIVYRKNKFDIISDFHQKNKTLLEKPNFNIIFQNLLKSCREEKQIGVFFCGNPILQKKLLKKCYKYSNNTLDIQLNFHKID